MTKKFARFTSIFLVALLMFSVVGMAFSVNAEEAEGNPYNIVESNKASLTLYKYEMPDVAAATTAGTGEMSDQVNVPEGAKLLAGVTFTVYQLDTDIMSYFDGSGDKTIPEAKDVPATLTADTVKYSKTTGEDGKVEFTDLPLGVYYVEETDGPANITKKIAPFVITLPLTDKTSSRWLYDVYCFPKNETAYGDVEVMKIDSKTGEPLPGAEFALYQKNGEEWVEYMKDIVVGEDGIAKVLALPAQMTYKFVETKTSDPSYILNSNNAYEFYIDATGDAIVDEAPLENNRVVVGNDTVDIHKFILDGEKGAEGIDNTANIGDTVCWKIRTDIPKDSRELTTYNIVDTMSKGLKYKDAEVYVDDTRKLEEGKDYTVTEDGLTVTFTFVPASLRSEEGMGEQVVVYYNTTLTEEAELAVDIPNTSELIYTNITGTNSTFTKKSETPTVHTGGYLFKKLADNKPLKDVTFAIYATEEDAKTGKNAIQTQTTGDDGVICFRGIKYGSFSADEEGKKANGVDGGSTEYWIMETKTPEGYIPLAAPFKVVINSKSHLEGTNKDVVNNPYPELPQTGAMGATLLLIIAGVMVAAGTVMLIRRRYIQKKD